MSVVVACRWSKFVVVVEVSCSSWLPRSTNRHFLNSGTWLELYTRNCFILRFFDCVVFALDCISRDSKDYLIGHRIRNALCSILNNNIVYFVVPTRSQSPTKVYMITYGNNTYYNFCPNTCSGHCNYVTNAWKTRFSFANPKVAPPLTYTFTCNLSYFCVPWDTHSCHQEL